MICLLITLYPFLEGVKSCRPTKKCPKLQCQRRHDLNAASSRGSWARRRLAAKHPPRWRQLLDPAGSCTGPASQGSRKRMDWSASITRWCGLMSLFFLGNHWNHGKPWKSLPTLMNRKPSQPVDISLVQHQVTRTCRLIVSIHLRPLDAEQQLLPFATVKMTHWMQLCNTTSQGRTKLLNDAIILPQLTWFCLNLFDGAGKYWKMWRTGLDIQLISWLSRMKYNSNRINNGNIFSICFKHDA